MSNPPGAMVSLDGKELGRTPISTNFTHYGKREFRAVKQGYETKTVLLPVRAPWYQWVGFDFVSEVLLPGKLIDHKYYELDLQPEQAVSGRELVARAEEFRQTAHADGVPRVGGPAVVVPPTPVGSIGTGSVGGSMGTPVSPPPNATPIAPSPIYPAPTGLPSNPSTFVPPRL